MEQQVREVYAYGNPHDARHEGFRSVGSAVHLDTAVTTPIPGVLEAFNSSGSGSILVLDDSEMICSMVEAMLTHLGYAVTCTYAGPEAIAAYQRALVAGRPFDAVILDLTISTGMNGQETMASLLAIDPQVKALISSGDPTAPVVTNFQYYGFKGQVTKPYTIQCLDEALQLALEDRSTTRLASQRSTILAS